MIRPAARLLTISVLAFRASFGAEPATPSKATILVWSDLHGKVPPGLKVVVDSLRDAHARDGVPFAAFDAGDGLFGSRLAHVTAGVSSTAEIKFLKPDAMILGMGDFAWSRDRLDSLLTALSIPVVTTNLRRNLDDRPIGSHRSLVLESSGLRMGVLGISDPELDYPERQERNGDMRVDPEEAAASWAVASLRQGGAGLVVALCHSSSAVAQNIGRLEGIDLVVAAHDATQASLSRAGAASIVHLPPGGGSVVRIDLEHGDSGWTSKVSTIPVPRSIPTNAAWKAMNATHDSVLNAHLGREVGTLKTAWPATRREASLGNWLADALRGGTGSDIAFVPASWVRTGLPKGRIKVQDVWNTVPEGLNMVSTFKLPGSDVMKILERQMRRSKEFLFVSGLTCTPDSSMYGGSPIAAKIGGKPLDKSAYYTIAIPKALREDIYEQTGISESSAGPEWTGLWEADLVVAWATSRGLVTDLGRVPAMYGGNAPK
jgi:5'-nucleotidase/UDP-sugar diphosphatase